MSDRCAPPGPVALTPAKSAAFSGQARRDTAPELALRRELHRRGLRYRVAVPPLPDRRRTADVVFPKARIAVYVDGCFWHMCPEHATLPRHNGEWWREKLEANVRRDRETDAELAEAGWIVIRSWEHESPSAAADRVEAAVAAGRRQAKARRMAEPMARASGTGTALPI